MGPENGKTVKQILRDLRVRIAQPSS